MTGETIAPRLAVAPLPRPGGFEILQIDTHRQLVSQAREIARRVADTPEFSVMFLSNPVLALEGYGIKLGREMRHHVLDTLRHPPKLRSRRQELEAALAESLGEAARPTDPEWMAALVFDKRVRSPLLIGDRTPAYSPALNAAAVERLQAARPQGAKRYPGQRRLKVTFSLKVAPEKQSVRRMDLDAELPDLKPAKRRPKTLTLEEAWFYKDDPVVRDAVELGQIMRRAFPFRIPAEFRAIADGKRADAFRTFITVVRLKDARPS